MVTNLRNETARLSLEVEIYSTETGEQFAEHYHFKSGEELASEKRDYRECFWDREAHPTFEEFKAVNDISDGVTEDDLDDECYYEGGFDVVFSVA